MNRTKSLSKEYKEYEVTIRVKCYQHPRKWVPDVVNESLIMDEKLLDWECELIEESDNEENPFSW